MVPDFCHAIAIHFCVLYPLLNAEPDFTKCHMFLGQHLCLPWNNIVINQSDFEEQVYNLCVVL